MKENYSVMNPRVFDIKGKPITRPTIAAGPVPIDRVLDKDWARLSFLMSDVSMSNSDNPEQMSRAIKDDLVNRYWSSASRKFTDTSMGGGVACNNRPQFTPYSDVRIKGRLSGRQNVTKTNTTGNYGMGRYYSEAIDDNAQTIYMRFGVPQYNSIWSFFQNAFNPGIAQLVLTGRAQSWMGKVAEVLGTFFTIAAFPVLSLTLVGTRTLVQFLTRPSSKFYSMKPTMYQYWSAVDMLVNLMVINRGLAPKIFGGNVSSRRIGDPTGMDSEFIKELHNSFPKIFDENGRVDIFAVALRAQSIANRLFMREYEALNVEDRESFIGYIREDGDLYKETYYVTDTGKHKLGSFLAKAANSFLWYNSKESNKPRLSEPSPVVELESSDESRQRRDSWIQEVREYLASELADGAAFAVFRVDSTGSSSESFSNSIMESDVSNKINEVGSMSRQIQFSLAGGNLGDDIISNTIESVIGGAKDIVMGALRGLTLDLSTAIEAALAGVYFDIPKTWQSSSANLPRASYSMQLIAPYGHPFSQLQNLYIPLSMILAAALPRSTGKQTYGPPFLCQLFDRGRCQIQLGMVDSLSISRGTSNLNFTNKGQPLAIDISFSVTDMSSIMHMPIGTGTIWDHIKSAFGNISAAGPHMDEDNVLMDYLATVTGLDIYNQFYMLPRSRLKAARYLMGMKKFSSPAWTSMAFHDQATSGTLAWLSLGTLPLASAVLEGMSNPAGVIGDRQQGR